MTDAANDAAFHATDADALNLEIRRLRGEVARLKELVSELEHLAYCDPLVNLPNRRTFLARLQNLIARAERYGDTGAVLFLDVDGLKAINDRHGHQAGDAALVEIARILVAVVRESDCIARVGGDEFSILLERTDELNAWRMGLRVVEAVVTTKFAVSGCNVRLSLAVGVAPVVPGATAEGIIDRADRSMYRVKAR